MYSASNPNEQVSVRFRRLATDCSLWKGSVWIHPRGDPGKVEFVVQKCLNSGTREFVLAEDEPSAENAHIEPPCYLWVLVSQITVRYLSVIFALSWISFCLHLHERIWFDECIDHSCRAHGTRGLETETERFPNMRLVHAERGDGLHIVAWRDGKPTNVTYFKIQKLFRSNS